MALAVESEPLVVSKLIGTGPPLLEVVPTRSLAALPSPAQPRPNLPSIAAFFGFLVCATFSVFGVTFPLCRYEWLSLVQAHMVEQYFKYDSGAKEFRGLSARDFGATTDAVALHPLQHAKRTAKT